MRPQFNSHRRNPNNQNQLNGANASAPQQQVMGNQGNLGQIGHQFQGRVLNNPQLPMQPFSNTNPFLAPNQFIPFPQGAFQNQNPNNWPQPFVQNAVNPSQFLPNGPLNMPNLVQSVAQILQMQMMNAGPQNLGLLLNGQMGGGNNNGILPQTVNGNGLNHNAQQKWDVFSPGAAKPQINAGVVNEVNDRNNNWRKSQNKNFTANHRQDESQRGFGNRQFHRGQNAQGNFKFNNDNRGRGNKSFGGKNFNSSNPSEQIQEEKKRSVPLNYTVKEIQQWREARKKNYPSKGNMEKKMEKNPKQPDATDEASKIRRQELKEILAKQAELGCEVAEIPSCYLSDTEQHNNKVSGKRGRFQNKFDKKGKFQQNDRFSKRQRYENNNSAKKPGLANGCATNLRVEHKSEPSLLKKLLSAEIKKDKKHLLQVFRFMVANNFFKNLPEKPLKFPPVIVKDSGGESEIVEQISEAFEGDTSNGLATL